MTTANNVETYISGRRTMFLVGVLFFLYLSSLNEALDNGLARTPPMGWMHWQRFRCLVDCELYPDECISEDLFRSMADHLVDDGYLEAGYEYIIIDDCWSKMTRSSEGKLEPDPLRFPSGIKNLSDYIHNKGLKFGIYGDYGSKTCQKYPGSLEHLETDARTFAEWGVDYLKLDGCNVNISTMEAGYREMGRLLNRTGRPMVYSCSWPAYQEPLGIQSNYSALAETCNLWRNWDDIDDSWGNITNILRWFSNNQDRIANFAGPGHWNDPDMLIIGNFGLSYEQSKAQMAIWAIMAAPLIMSVDLRSIETQFKKILLNQKAIQVNQDPLGHQGKLQFTIKKIDVWTKPISPVKNNDFSYAIGFLSNRVDGYPYRLNVTLSELNLTRPEGYLMTDVFDANVKPWLAYPNDDLIIRVKPTGVVFLLANTSLFMSNDEKNLVIV